MTPILPVASGLCLAIAGSLVLRSQPVDYTNAKALGVVLLLTGEVILFRVAWWWAIIGLGASPLIMGVITARAIASRRRDR